MKHKVNGHWVYKRNHDGPQCYKPECTKTGTSGYLSYSGALEYACDEHENEAGREEMHRDRSK